MIRKLMIIVVLILCFDSCVKSVSDNSLLSINIDDYVKEHSDIVLSNLADSLSYTQILGSPDLVIGRIRTFCFNREHILIYDDQTNRLILCDRTGNYIRDFLQYGKGPNEFVDIGTIDFSSDGKVLVIMNGNFFKTFDTKGNVIASAFLDASPSRAIWIDNSSIALFYPYPKFINNHGYEITIVDDSGVVLSNHLKRKTSRVNNREYAPMMTCGRNKDIVYYWNQYESDIYHINRNHEVKTGCKILRGDLQYPIDKIKQGNLLSPDFTTEGVYVINNYFEYGDMIFIDAFYDQTVACLIIDGRTGTGGNVHVNRKKMNSIGIFNDLDYGASFWPRSRAIGNKPAMALEPNELREIFLTRSKNPSDDCVDNVRLLQIISRLNYLSNPIIVTL